MASIRTGITSTRNKMTSSGRSSHRQSTEPFAQDYFFWMARDGQRKKVYDAEAAFGWGDDFGAKQRMSELCVYKVIDALENSMLLAEYTTHPKYFTPDVTLKGKQSGGSYCPTTGVHAGKFTHEYVIIHEWAHHAITVTLGDIHAPHGEEFVRCLLDAVHAILGIKAYKALSEEFALRNVRVATTSLDIVPRLFGGPKARDLEIED